MESKVISVVVVGGCGHVGLPMSILLAHKGFNVKAYDISPEAVSSVNCGVVPFIEEGAIEMLSQVLENKNFEATVDPSCLTSAEIVIIVIGTPVDEHLSPNPTSVIDSVLRLSPYLKDGQLLVLRSTIFPGVSEKLERIIKKDFPKTEVVFCPERIVEGQALNELISLPQIVGASNNIAFDQAEALFKGIGTNCIRTTFREAELAKLFTNVWRYIKFAAANQFWMMSTDLNVDYEKVRDAIRFEYPRAADLPHAGFAAGPCLFKDTMQLSALVQQNFPLGQSAMMINEGTPGFLVKKLTEKYDLESLNIGILGMAFKANVDDTRSSLAYKLKKQLEFRCKKVMMSDPFVKDERLYPLQTLLSECDLLIIGAPHDLYKSIQTNKPVIDIWGLFGREALI
jgi:UDP-N-acetyl-D-mannosaminuronic acid dehydrogenase